VIVFMDMLNIVGSVSGFFEDLSPEMLGSLKKKVTSEIDIVFGNLQSVPLLIFNKFSGSYFLSGYDKRTKLDEFVLELNDHLEKAKPANTRLIDIDKMISRVGLNASLDRRLFASSKAPYTIALFKTYCLGIQPILLGSTGKLKKAIIFDCDNTLWKGILG